MKLHSSTIRQKHRHKRGFTLIELLVVIAIISLLMAILFPVLRKARVLTQRIVCQSNLRQIAAAWLLYLKDSDGVFYQGVNANHFFGGWIGTGFPVIDRPLNEYLGLDPNVPTEDGAKVFCCPADKGGIFGLPQQELAYQYYGNSYQTSIFLIGPTKIGPGPGNLNELHNTINSRLKNISIAGLSANSSLLPLLGDNNWMSEWHPLMPHSRDWHDKSRHHNLVFLDGHADFIKIRKGLYVTPEYTLLPFRDLHKLAIKSQKEVE
ncbi:MAG: type II secretion system protein [Planctomycetota bacterium]|jgi:prepilin-type N-terminal cleavage/methylation domain-containing protein